MLNFDPAKVIAAARHTESFILSTRFWEGKLVLKMEGEAYVLEVSRLAVVDFRRDDSLLNAELVLNPTDLVLSGPAASWDKLLQAVPPPGFQDPLFSAAGAAFEIAGDPVRAMAPFYFSAQEFLDVLRSVRNSLPAASALSRVDRDFDDAVGRYMYVDIQGEQYRIYFEEAGKGSIPMVLQHTAGADSRQWRHVLEDPDYQKHYRIVSFDLPFHGRSLPPTTQTWWNQQYKLTREFLMDAVIAVSRKLALERPVYMGCSVGGMLAPDLAFYHPDKFRAVIALNGALGHEHVGEGGWDERILAAWERWSDPRTGPQWTMALMRSNTAPTSCETYRRENMWIYGQGGPGVNEGDINYYAFDHDLTAEQASQIDTSVVGVYLITGEYDGLAFDNASKRLADAIEGSHFTIVPGLGHFGPAENPDGMKTALLPVLEEIAAKSTS